MPYHDTDGLAFDWTANKLYVTDEVLNIVGVLDLTTSIYTVLIRESGDTRLRAIVLDPYAGYIYTLYFQYSGGFSCLNISIDTKI